jgi:anthranilate synthase component 1
VTSQHKQTVCKVHSQRFELFSLVRANPQRYPYLLESTAHEVGQHKNTARYDILFCFPQQILRKNPDGTLELDGLSYPGKRFLTALDELWREHRQGIASLPDLPFSGGWFVYLGYELAAEIEPGLQLPGSDSRFPIAQASRIPAAVIYDHVRGQTSIVVESGYAELLNEIEHDLFSLSTIDGSTETLATTSPQLHEDDPQEYLDNTQKILNYIREGDVFQVNLSRQWLGRYNRDNMQYPLYQRLRVCNPAPFAGFVALAEGAIVSSSPERLIRVNGQRIETRPIAGTRPRMPTQTQDKSIQEELIAHPKERAEHVMLIDLERNDLGRLCVPGTVRVDEMMAIESYAHVHHIVSNVCGQLRPDVSPGEVIAAVFPGGTITGCPKVRCMEIIAELEHTARGAYTGSFGYLNHNGDMDLNILIRTLTLESGVLRFRTGAGLVADSIAIREVEETRAKAKGLLTAIAGQTEAEVASLSS